MVMKIITVIFLCAALSRTKAEEEECHIYEKESPKIKNQYLSELAQTFYRELQDKPYLKLNQTVVDSIRGRMSLAIVNDDGDSKIIVNLIHLKNKNKVADESDSDSDEDIGLFGDLL